MNRTFARFFLGLLACLAALPVARSQTHLSAVFARAAEYESGAPTDALRQIENWVAAAAESSRLRRQLETELARLLTAPATYEARRFACQQLAIVGDEACLPALARLVKDPATTDIACLALRGNASARANDVLRSAGGALSGRGANPLARAAILETLGNRQDSKSVKLLIASAGDPDPLVATAAIVALGRIADPAARQALAALRQEANPVLAPAVQEASLRAADRLAAADDHQAATRLYEAMLQPTYPDSVRRGALIGLFNLDHDRGEDRALDVLRTRDAALIPVAIARVPLLRNPDAPRRFAALIADAPPAEQILLIEALAARGDASVRTNLQAQLTAADPGVRLAAIAAVGQLGDASSVPVLSHALLDAPSAEETKAVELAFVSLQGGDAVDRALMARLRDRMAGPKAPILAALVRRGNRVALPALQAETAGSDPAMVRLAFQGLSRLATDEDLPSLLKALNRIRAPVARGDAEAAVAQALERTAPPARRSELVRAALAQAESPESRDSFLRLLPVGGDVEALTALESGLDNRDTREVAVRALADWPNDGAWDTLMQLYAKADTEAQRVVLLRGLTRIAGEANATPNPLLIERYGRLFAAAKTDSDRRLILGAVAGCQHPDALRLAVEQLGNAGVRAEAAQAVKAIAEAIKAQHPQAAQAALEQLK